MRQRQNGRNFAHGIFKYIFMNENVWIPIKISPKFVPKDWINNIPALVQIMAWRRAGDKPLSEPMVVSLPMHICVTQPQWVNSPYNNVHCMMTSKRGNTSYYWPFIAIYYPTLAPVATVICWLYPTWKYLILHFIIDLLIVSTLTVCVSTAAWSVKQYLYFDTVIYFKKAIVLRWKSCRLKTWVDLWVCDMHVMQKLKFILRGGGILQTQHQLCLWPWNTSLSKSCTGHKTTRGFHTKSQYHKLHFQQKSFPVFSNFARDHNKILHMMQQLYYCGIWKISYDLAV